MADYRYNCKNYIAFTTVQQHSQGDLIQETDYLYLDEKATQLCLYTINVLRLLNVTPIDFLKVFEKEVFEFGFFKGEPRMLPEIFENRLNLPNNENNGTYNNSKNKTPKIDFLCSLFNCLNIEEKTQYATCLYKHCKTSSTSVIIDGIVTSSENYSDSNGISFTTMFSPTLRRKKLGLHFNFTNYGGISITEIETD